MDEIEKLNKNDVDYTDKLIELLNKKYSNKTTIKDNKDNKNISKNYIDYSILSLKK